MCSSGICSIYDLCKDDKFDITNARVSTRLNVSMSLNVRIECVHGLRHSKVQGRSAAQVAIVNISVTLGISVLPEMCGQNVDDTMII